MKKLLYFLRWGFAFAFFSVMLIAPEHIFGASGVIFAANFITSSITWTGKQNLDYFLKPMFIGKSPWETQGVRIIPNVQSTLKLNYFGIAEKMLRAYSKGFTGTAGTAHTQRDLTVHRLKAEASEDANAFYQTVFEQSLKLGEWNDLNGTQLRDIIVTLYRNAVSRDVFRIFWLGDVNKETVSSGVYTGVADTNYNMLDGMWKLIFSNAATTPSATQIKRVTVADGAIAQVATVTINGGATTTNTLIIRFHGVTYSQAYVTSYTQTATNFVASHAAALLKRGAVVTSSGATIIFTSAIPGQPFTNPTIATASTITGSVAATTANTVPSALAAGESEDIFLALHEGAPQTLKEYPTKQKVLIVAQEVWENYITYLESFTADGGRKTMIDGVEYITYRGIPVMPLAWGVHLGADFPAATGYLWGYPHRCIYTTLDNLVMGIDAMSEYNETRMWYNMDEQENRFRTQLKMGTQYVHNELMAVAY